ncbi:MFS transporter [Breoghania sp. L-A4]|uniref:MFS transporter n=1 Tax=Breoghania sp. L-A4 TaxID=2304600 RepID=UPI000E358CFB|nr:MFS transporter [Breoghania sp. L-A4]AXS40021.1 MFS transporter [Breoghania sp. L-A4]
MSTTAKPATATPADVDHPTALVFHSATLILVFAGAGAPTPLYRLYQEHWHASPLMITSIFGVYAVSLLAALLIGGSISDHVGRRPTIFVALLLQIATMAVFIVADSTMALLAARLVQGLATGVAASSIGAALVDSSRRHGPLINSLSPLIGMAIGAALSGVLVTFAPAPMRLIYIVMLAVNLLLALAIWRIPETIVPRPGALASLKPRVVVPVQARRALALTVPIIIALWTLGGFYMSLIPTLIGKSTGIQSPLLGALVVSALMSAGAVAVYLQRNRTPFSTLTLGSSAIVTGVTILIGGIHMGNVPVLLGASLLIGIGMGSSFLASVGMILPLAEPDQRAELLAAFYIICYLSMCLPAILAGFTANAIGIPATADIFATAVAIMTLGGYAAIAIFRDRPGYAVA